MSLTAGTTIGHYKIDREIGRGGMGVVFLATDTRLHRTVALKALPDDVAQDPDRLQRFEREARVLASLNHPNIAAIYGLEEADGRKYLALEHIEGETLADRIARGPIPLPEMLDLCTQIASGMEAAHDAGVVHRDLKPANVMITPADQVKILDFGLAKGRVATDESGLAKSPAMIDSPATLSSPTLAHSPTFMGTMPGMILGTAAYLSPEQARGKIVDRRTDIWSFGCVLFECLTGRLAFDGETVSDTIAKILERPMDWSALPKNTPARLRELLERCLERDPKRRLRDIGDARITLEEIKSGRHAAADAPQISPHATQEARRRTAILAAASAILGAVMGVAAWSALHHGGGAAESRVSYYSIALPRGTRFQDGTGDDRTIAMICRPLATSEGEASLGRIYIRGMDEPEFQPVRESDGTSNIMMSPDGRTLEYWAPAGEQTSDRRRYRMPADRSAPPASVGDVGATWDNDNVWLRSGDLVVSMDDGTRYLRLPPNGNPGAPARFQSPIPGARFYPIGRELSGGKAIFLRAIYYEGSVYHQGVAALDLKSGRVKMMLTDGNTPVTFDGVLCYAKLDGIYAVRFDPGKLEAQGTPIAIMNGLRQQRTSTNASFGMSPGGTLFYASGGNVARDRRVATFDRQGNATEWTPEHRPFEYGIHASPDGSRVLTQINNPSAITELWILRRGDATPRRVHSRPGSDVIGACWSADGRWIAFTQIARDSSDGIYVVDLDGVSEPRRIALKPTPNSYIVPSSWNQDGLLLATAVVDNRVSIWGARVTPDQAQPVMPRKVLEAGGNIGAGAFSPDGRYVVYQTNESGRPEIFVTAWSGENPTGQPVLVSRGGGGIPRWSRDGKQIYYSLQGKLMSSDIGRTPSLTASAPVVAWNLAALRVPPNSQGDGLYDLLPDGHLVAVQGSEQEGDITQIQIALHFDQLVRQKIRSAK